MEEKQGKGANDERQTLTRLCSQSSRVMKADKDLCV